MGVSLGVFSQGFGSLCGFLSNRFLDLGAVSCGTLSSPLTRIEKTPRAELSEALFKINEYAPGKPGEAGGLRLRRDSEARGSLGWGQVQGTG